MVWAGQDSDMGVDMIEPSASEAMEDTHVLWSDSVREPLRHDAEVMDTTHDATPTSTWALRKVQGHISKL